MSNNLSSRLISYLHPDTINLIKHAANLADKNNTAIYLVGGIVRDLLLSRKSFDIDMVVEGDALYLAEKLASTGGVKKISHTKFGTAKLSVADFIIDIVTARREEYKKPGALPTIFPGSISEDLFRRDFTINAMAIQLNSSQFGRFIDPYNGREDLVNGLIRILHDKSFKDDATRIFRAVRYEQRLDFNIEKKTAQSLKRNIDMIDTVSSDRTKHELQLFLSEPMPEKALLRAAKLGILSKIHPGLEAGDWVNKRFLRARKIINKQPLNLIYLCLLIYQLKENYYRELIKRFNFTKSELDAMTGTLTLKSRIASEFKDKMSSLDVYKLLKPFDITAIYANMIAEDSAKISRKLDLFVTSLRFARTRLTGKDLIGMGIRPGPEIGNILNKLLQARILGTVKSKKEEELLVRKLAN